MAPPPALSFTPPLLNSACPWATDVSHLRSLLICPSTGAVTTRTSLLGGFDHDPGSHRFAFFDPRVSKQSLNGGTYSYPDNNGSSVSSHAGDSASLNNLGYSPLTLDEYLLMLRDLARGLPETHRKTVIISVTGSPEDVAACYALVASHVSILPYSLAMEINLSCPNITGRPPPAYSAEALASYIHALPEEPIIPLGVKTPPYTHAGQFDTLVTALEGAGAASKLSFITATNTLGSCIIMDADNSNPVLPGTGVGGMAGPPLHPLALGNVLTIRKLLDERGGGLERIKIIGVGGVSDGDGYQRMRAAGASAVGLATALGKKGVDVFSKIEEDIESSW